MSVDDNDGCGKSCLLWLALGALWVVAVSVQEYWDVHAGLVYFGVIGVTVFVVASRQKL